MKKLMVGLGVAFATSVSAFAATVEFPNKDGSGDLSSADAWGFEPTSDLKPRFIWSNANATYTSLKDMTFAGMEFAIGSESPVTFDMTDGTAQADPGPRVITLNGNFEASGKSAMTLKGGLWNVTGLIWPSGYGQKMKLNLDGVRLNAGTLSATYGNSDNCLVDIYGQSCVTTSSLRVQYNHGSGSKVIVRDGSELVAKTEFNTGNSNGRNNGLIVTGEGSVFRFIHPTAVTSIGNEGRDSYLLVDDHAYAEFSTMPRVGVDTIASNGYITVQNGGTLNCKDHLAIGNKGRGARLNVLSGGTVTVGDILVIGGHDYVTHECFVGVTNGTLQANRLNLGNRGQDCTMRVSGTNGTFEAKSTANTSLVGDNAGHHATLIVEDHATAAFHNRLNLGNNAAATNALVRVTGGAKLTAPLMSVGTNGKAPSYARLEVLDGGVVEVPDLYLGGPDYVTTDNSALVSNATLTVNALTLGNKTECVRQSFCLMGPEAALNINSTGELSLFTTAPDCRFVIDSATWTPNRKVSMCTSRYAMGRCRVELVNGATLSTSNAFIMTGENYASYSNTLYVGSNSHLYAGEGVWTFSYGNEMTVSNAVVETLGKVAFTERSYSAYIGRNSNNWVRVQGSCPQILATNGTFSVKFGSHLVFDYPVEGYDADIVPIKAKTLAFDSDCDLAVNVPAEACEAFEGTRNVKLVETTGGITISSAILEAAKAKLPPKCDLYVRDNCLWLKAKGKPLGMLLLVR